MKNLFLITFLSLSLFNSSIAATNSNNNSNNNNKFIATTTKTQDTINSAKIELIDNYLETIILNLVIKKIDLQLKVLQAYKNNNSAVKTSFISKNSELDNVDSLQLHKSKLQQQLTILNNNLSNNNFVKTYNDLNTTKLLNTNNFSLQKDNLSIIAFIKNYQQILKQQQQISKTLNDEIHQGKRSEFDIHFTAINKLDNQIFLKKAAKIYFIEKLKQQPTIKNFNELNSYLINPLDANIVKF